MDVSGQRHWSLLLSPSLPSSSCSASSFCFSLHPTLYPWVELRLMTFSVSVYSSVVQKEKKNGGKKGVLASQTPLFGKGLCLVVAIFPFWTYCFGHFCDCNGPGLAINLSLVMVSKVKTTRESRYKQEPLNSSHSFSSHPAEKTRCLEMSSFRISPRKANRAE